MILFNCPHCEAPITSNEMMPGYDKLTFTQQQIADCLARRPGRRYHINQLAEYVWLGRDEPERGVDTLRVQISHMNRRLGRKIVFNQRGVGYYLVKGNDNEGN